MEITQAELKALKVENLETKKIFHLFSLEKTKFRQVFFFGSSLNLLIFTVPYAMPNRVQTHTQELI